MREKTRRRPLHTARIGICSYCQKYCGMFLSVFMVLHIFTSTPAKSENCVRMTPEVAWPGDSIHVEYNLTGVNQVRRVWGRPGAEVLEPGAVTDLPSYGEPVASPAASAFNFDLKRSTFLTIVPADGSPSPHATATVNMLYGLGYSNAHTPLGGVCRPILDGLSNDLQEIDKKLKTRCIQDNQLTNDILTKMAHLLIYTARWQLPASVRSISPLCNPNVYGWYHQDLNGVAICSEAGAFGHSRLDSLLRQLYRFTADPGNSDPLSESKADSIAKGCFGYGLLSSEQQAALKAHNDEREKYCASHLLWSPELAQWAQEWAQKQRLQNGQPVPGHHTNEQKLQNPFRPKEYVGENIAWGVDTEAAAVGEWVEEAQNYHYNEDNGYGGQDRPPGCMPPANLPPTSSKSCGHFTQVIWNRTQYVGCGKSTNSGLTFVVCNYYPPGNYGGQKPY